MVKSNDIFQFSWEENQGLDLHLIAWQQRALKGDFDPIILEMIQALYSAFCELRKICKIMAEGKPGTEHSYYQYMFELFAHNHFLSIAVNRVLKIFGIAYPKRFEGFHKKHEVIIDRVNRYRNALEHQTDISRRKDPPKFFNNLSSNGYESEDNVLPYKEIEDLLNEAMLEIENIS
jgi:hypothetical protein